MRDLLRGKLVSLGAEEPGVLAGSESNWQRDSELHRLSDAGPARMWSEKKRLEWREKEIEKGPDGSYFRFSIRAREPERLIGEVMLRVDWPNADAWLGISIGEREYWGKGYGLEAMRLMLAFGFLELNLRRITLGVDSINPRALRAYEKLGFRHEGVMRREMLREGERYDSFWMGLLREEWQAGKEART
jgi:RimJ/RimL family protein N-acetyltransferase